MVFRIVASSSILFVLVLSGCGTGLRSGIDGSLVAFPNGSSRPVAGSVTVSSSRPRRLLNLKTARDGSFSLDLPPGSYVLNATTTQGVKCREDSVIVRRGQRDDMTLICI